MKELGSITVTESDSVIYLNIDIKGKDKYNSIESRGYSLRDAVEDLLLQIEDLEAC